MAVLTNDHKLCGLKEQKFTLSSGGQKVEIKGSAGPHCLQRLLGHRAVCSPQPTPQGVFQDPVASGTVWDAVAPTKLPFVRACSVAELCLTLCEPMDYRPPGSSVHVVSQARMLEWVAISFSRGSSQPRDWINICIGRRILYP